MDLYLLITDYLFWFLVLLGFVYFFWAKNQYLHRQVWAGVIISPVALSALLIFLFFLIIAMLDSVHWLVTDQSSNLVGKIYSVLDYMLDDFFVSEISYSKPFAKSLFVSVLQNQVLQNIQPINDILEWWLIFLYSFIIGFIITLFS